MTEGASGEVRHVPRAEKLGDCFLMTTEPTFALETEAVLLAD